MIGSSIHVRQPYVYRRRELAEPDWRRLPGWADVTRREWESAQWQRAHCVKNVAQLRQAMGNLLDEVLYADVARDQAERATMPMLVTPQMLSTMVPDGATSGRAYTEAFYADAVRRYMIPVFSDRRTDWPSHPRASRDSLHEAAMWTVEGLVHRYPTKVLAELLPTCPQYCGHCTRMDLVGTATVQASKRHFDTPQRDRLTAMLDYLRKTPSVRDVVVSGGDVANMPWLRLEQFVDQLLEIDSVRDIRLASKALVGLPQHWLTDDVRAGMERLTLKANQRSVQIAIHTHANGVQSITPLVVHATRALLRCGVRTIRNQGVLLRGVNDTAPALLDLSFALQDNGIEPYYLYMCDVIPFSEHWRLAIREAQVLQHEIMGYLPGFATPRIVCDVPCAGKRWVHQLAAYDLERGISYWQKNYRTTLDSDAPEALQRLLEYYDPIYTLPESGQAWWRDVIDAEGRTGAQSAPDSPGQAGRSGRVHPRS